MGGESARSLVGAQPAPNIRLRRYQKLATMYAQAPVGLWVVAG